MSENNNFNNLDNLPTEVRELLLSYFELYNSAKKHKDIYKNDIDNSAVKTLISFYFNIVKPDYNKLLYNFKNKYISNEILVEKNNSLYERRGVSLAYNYIQDFDVNKDKFSIFLCSMKIHNLIFQPVDDLHAEEDEIELKEIAKLEEEARKEKSIEKYKKAIELKKEHDGRRVKIGGQIRDNNVRLAKLDIETPPASEAKAFFNSFLQPDKIKEYEDHKNNDDIFDYIEYCVKTTTDLIYYQPFQDGNKRAFRSVLNLMFKVRNIPPVYIKPNEREEYKDALVEAIVDKNYNRIVGFYLYKICDSIYELDIEPYNKQKDENSITKK